MPKNKKTAAQATPEETQAEPQAEVNAAEREAELQKLQQELEEAHRKAAESSEGWQRERADFLNYK